jgi:membrane-associated phospholipid phosphatase
MGMPPRPAIPLRVALACAVGLAITGVLAELVPVVQARDEAGLDGFTDLNRPHVQPVLDAIARLADPLPYALIGLALAAVALGRGRPRTALAIPIVLVGAGATTETLKLVLSQPEVGDWLGGARLDEYLWPSGHATASMALGLCAVLAVPQRARPVTALIAAAFALAVSYAILVLDWHLPSDVLGGFLVAGLWTSLAAAALAALERRRPTRVLREAPARPMGPTLVLGLGGALAAAGAAVALGRPDAVSTYALQRPAFVVGAMAIAALALVLVAGLSSTLGGGPQRR